jgi:hypothetical protein
MDLESNDMKATLHEINAKAQAILARELDPLEYIEFFRQYELGLGDYTRDRETILGNPSLATIIGEIHDNDSSKPS